MRKITYSGAVVLVLLILGMLWKRHIDYTHPEIHIMPTATYSWHLDRYVHYTLHPSDNWPNCGPHQVRLIWPPEKGWIAGVLIDLRKRSISGGATNGISYTVPFPRFASKGMGLNPGQVATIGHMLRGLPAGESYETSRVNYATELHIAYDEDGVMQVRHYPATQLPANVFHIAEVLGLAMPLQK